MKYLQDHNTWVWSDGWPINYINWGHQDNTNEEACVSMNMIDDGTWDARSCDTPLPFMCKSTAGMLCRNQRKIRIITMISSVIESV